MPTRIRLQYLIFFVILILAICALPLALSPSQSALIAQPPTATRTPTPINIGNFVWDDLDRDGRQDAGEPGLAGITVQLWNSNKTALIDSTVTNASGIYTVIAPLPGNYRVRVLLPNSLDTFSPMNQAGGDDLLDSDINVSGVNFGFTDVFNIASNVISMTLIDAGIIRYFTPTPTRTPTPINIGNFVWDDLDRDGRQDAGEPGLAGITVQLWNSNKTALIDATVTNASGIYTVTAPIPGNYRVRVLLPNSLDAFSPMNQAGGDDLLDSDINVSGVNFGFTDVFNIASNVISTTLIDAGIIRYFTPTPTRTPTPINVGNFVWWDIDGDGRQDAGEPGLAGVTVQLWNSDKTTLFGTTTTNASGIYTLIAPLPGNYRVRAILPNPLDQFSPKDQAGGDDLQDSDINPTGVHLGFTDTYNFSSNLISITSIDIGIQRFVTATPTRTPTPINVGNFVWNDANANGIQDAGELGISGVTVEIWNSNKTMLLATTTTNNIGHYMLTVPGPGQYRVRVILPSGTSFSLKDQLGNDTVDSDINTAGIHFGFTDIYNFPQNLISITTIDAGIVGFSPTDTPAPTATLTPTETPPGFIPSDTPVPTETPDGFVPSNTPTEDPLDIFTDTPTPNGSETATPTPPVFTDTPEGESLPFFTDTPEPPSTYPPPPTLMYAEDVNFQESSVVMTGIAEHLVDRIVVRVLYEHGVPTQWLGPNLYNIENIGIAGLEQLGIQQAIDFFSPVGLNYFEGGAVFCLQGTGPLIWLAASQMPRHAEIIGSYTVPEFEGFTCATLFEPGTLVLVTDQPQ